jgi:hypothetical protein
MSGLAKRRTAGVTGVLLLLMSLTLAIGLPAGASHVAPVLVTGNENCEAVTGLDEIFRDESNPITSGNHDVDGDGDDDIFITVNGGAQTFDWSTDEGLLIHAVFVKGGPDGNLYDYRPAGATSDTGLHAPVNPQNQNFYGLSHLSFCVDETPPTTTTTAPTTTTTQATTSTSGPTTTTTAAPTTTSGPTTTTTAAPTTTSGPTTTTTQATTTTTLATTTTTRVVTDSPPTTPSTTATTLPFDSVPESSVLGIQATAPVAAQVGPTTADTLPFTGASTGSMAGLAAALAAGGAILLVASRRVEEKSTERSWN